MAAQRESDFAEILVDRLLLESFSNEQSPYYPDERDSRFSKNLDAFRGRLNWHISHSLSPRQKQVLRQYLSGKKEREIAHELGIKQQVVNIYKHRAIKKLQSLMSQ
jgi:RNA polymerase sigma factor (sigma-70 family)